VPGSLIGEREKDLTISLLTGQSPGVANTDIAVPQGMGLYGFWQQRQESDEAAAIHFGCHKSLRPLQKIHMYSLNSVDILVSDTSYLIIHDFNQSGLGRHIPKNLFRRS
jgi:hypothetical protein